jgi:hydroxypyruvate reductase
LNRTRKHALRIFRAALDASAPDRAVLRHVSCDGRVLKVGTRRYKLDAFDRIQVIGAGKAAAAMAQAVEKLLGKRIAGGLINIPGGVRAKLRRIELNHCGHPIPDERGAAGAARMLEIARAAGPRDLLICVISGGASALLPAPRPPLTLKGKQEITSRLLASGATIHEMNTVRKHLSAIKGGQLAAAADSATVITLLLSDVVGDDPEVIGSGPTVGDPTSVSDAAALLKKYGIPFPAEALKETPKPGDPRLAKAHFVLAGSNRQAMDAAAQQARELGYQTLVLSTTIEGETRDIAAMHAAIAREVFASGRPVRRPACLLSGGETTVTLRGRGMGGRNQEFVLAAALALDGRYPVTILSAGTDGIDGPTPAAGAIADADTLRRAAALGLDGRALLENNDSYRFFKPLGDLIETGPTGTNVMDVRVFLIPTDRSS